MTGNIRYLAVTLLVLSLSFGLAQVLLVGLTCDTDLFMQQALILWRHEGMYSRVIQINAPFNIMVYAPLAAFAAFMQFSPAIVLHGFSFCVGVAGLLSLNHALKRHGVPAQDRGIWCAAMAFILFVTTPMFEVFADREHLLIGFAMPWIMQMLLGFEPLAYTAVLAAIGFCMRPHDVILFAALTLIGGPEGRPLRRRLFSPSSFIIGTIMAAYALSVVVFFPDYLAKMVPMGSLIYSAGQVPMSRKLALGAPFIVLSLAGLLGFIRTRRFVWYGFVFTMIVIFFLNSGWDYTFYWLLVPLVLINAAPWCCTFSERLQRPAIAHVASAAIILLLLAVSGDYLVMQIDSTRETGSSVHHHHLPATLTAGLRAAAGTQFILLSPMAWNIDIEPFNGQPRSVFGFDVVWPLFWLFKHTSDPHFDQVLHFVTVPLLDALKDHPYAPVIVDTSPKLRLFGGDGKVLEFLERDPEIKTIFGSYVMEKEMNYCTDVVKINCRFEIWRRR